jgi:hypothetical protein
MGAGEQEKGTKMAHEEEPILSNPPTPEVARHVRDYTRFIKLLTWGAIVSLVTAFVVIIFIL